MGKNMFDQLTLLAENFTLSDSVTGLLVNTGFLLAVIIILRTLTARFIRHKVKAPELKGRLLANTRNGFLLLILLGLAIIWGDQLRTLALSILAIAVAFVVATKELISCITGSLLKGGSGSFNIGDRIQIRDFRGDVIDQSLLTTTILEVGPGSGVHQRTGHVIVIPNAVFLSEPVVNETFSERYDFHVFTVPFMREDNWRAAQEAFLAAANRHCQPYLESVRRHMNKIGERRGLEMPSVDPRVTIQVPDAEEIHLVIRIPTKAGQRSYLEQLILSEVFFNNDFSSKLAEQQTVREK